MKKITVEIKEEYLSEFIDKLIVLRDKECEEKCITIFGLTLEEYKKHCLNYPPAKDGWDS